MTKFTVPQIMQFILANYSKARDWDAPSLYNWICWNIEMGFCLMVGDDEKLLGLALVRPVMHPEQVLNTLDYDPEGDTYFIDLAIATKPKRAVVQALGFAILNRFGQRDKIAWQRHGIGPVFVVDANYHRQRLLRSCHLAKEQ